MGDADVLPSKCNYFKSIPMTMDRLEIDVYMDLVVNVTLPRFSMCYIGARLRTWNKLIPRDQTIEGTLKQIFNESNYPAAYKTNNVQHPIMNFDELFLGQRIKSLKCYPNCTTLGRSVRNYKETIRGPLGPNYTWVNTLQTNSTITLSVLARLIEAHIGKGPFSLYGDQMWPILNSLLSIYMEDNIITRLREYARTYFRLNVSRCGSY